jgi:pimeloyl-ACP methyl ester carboxylesterase
MERRAREWLEAGSHFEWVPLEPMRHTSKLSIFHAEFGAPEAPLLLMVHGFPTSSIDWRDVVGELTASHRVCVLDLPGFGFSDKPKDESYTLHRDSELVRYYLAEILGAHTGAVVAHDRGDSVALTFARRCPAGETASSSSPDAPGALSADPGAPVFLDRSRSRMPLAEETLRGVIGDHT